MKKIILFSVFLLVLVSIFSGCESDTTYTQPTKVEDTIEEQPQVQEVEETTEVQEAEPQKEEENEVKVEEQKTQTPQEEVVTTPQINVCPQFKEIEKSFNNEIVKMWYDDYDSIDGTKDVDGWKISGGYQTWEGYFSYCHKGSKTGENINYFYCGEDLISPLITVKKVTDSEGNIKEALEKRIVIVLDKEGKFIETICKT